MKFTITFSALLLTLLFDIVFAGGRIFGGRPIEIEQAPFMVQIIAIKSDGGGEQCGGSMITTKLILTACHCVKDAETGEVYKDYIIHTGETKFINDGTNQHTVKNVHPHPKYMGAKNAYHHDVAVLELNDHIILSDKTKLVKLANMNDKPTPGSKGIVTGWGTNPEHPDDDRLYRVNMTIITPKQCVGHYKGADTAEELEKHEICAQDEEKAHCQGDSGGAFIDAKSGRQIGVVSYGPTPCTRPGPSIFANVKDNMGFIYQIMAKVSSSNLMPLGGRHLSLN